MSPATFRTYAISGWCIATLLFVGISIAGGAEITFGRSLLVLIAAVAPPALLLAIFRGAPPKTVAQVLYDQEQTTDVAGRLPRPAADATRP